MSNRTLIELNHDYCPIDIACEGWGRAIQNYMTSGDPAHLPEGVTFKNIRHHSTPCPLEEKL